MPSPARTLPSRPGSPILFPAVFLEKGALGFPDLEDPSRFHPLRDKAGAPVDIFDAADVLLARYQRLYVVDLDGVNHRRPQFEYLQEISQGKEMWVDAGPRNVDEVMDVIVAGASRAVMSTKTLASAREITRTLKLTSQVALEIAVDEQGATVASDPKLEGASSFDVASEARDRGVVDLILASQSAGLQLELAQELARTGPTYIGGPFQESDAPSLATLGISGGIFSARSVLKAWTTSGS